MKADGKKFVATKKPVITKKLLADNGCNKVDSLPFTRLEADDSLCWGKRLSRLFGGISS